MIKELNDKFINNYKAKPCIDLENYYSMWKYIRNWLNKRFCYTCFIIFFDDNIIFQLTLFMHCHFAMCNTKSCYLTHTKNNG